MIDISTSANYIGDCRVLLDQLPDGCVQTCVTSPPYFGLRDYGTSRWVGGDAACDHSASKPSRTAASVASSTLGGGKATVHASHVFRGSCGRCGAQRSDDQIGLEETPDLFVAAMVDVFAKVRRVLRDDGTLWLNLGDSYASIACGYDESGSRWSTARISAKTQSAVLKGRRRVPSAGLKPKDLIGVPWRVAFALRADGWYLRSDIVWSKPNPMPESVTDRPTKAHEYLFLLSKSSSYLYDAAAIAEPLESDPKRCGRHSKKDPGMQATRARAMFGEGRGGRDGTEFGNGETRNKRSVWTVATVPYASAHFATFPPKLIEPCILAGSRVGDIVLDPFFGSGTTGMVAEKHGRRWIGFDLGYDDLAKERTAQRSLMGRLK